MAISNAIAGVNTTFATGVGDWSVTNATAVRDLNRSVYTNAIKYNSSTAKVREHAAKVTATSTTAPTFELDSLTVSGGKIALASCNVASSVVGTAYARMDLAFYDSVGAQTGSTVTGTSTDVEAQASSLVWSLLMVSGQAPDDAVTAKVTLTFGRNSVSDVISTAVVGDYWLVASPGLVSFTNFDWFMEYAYQNLPGFVRNGDKDYLFLKRFMTTLFKPSSEIREIAKNLRYDRAAEGTEHLPVLADPDNMSYLYFEWLASILGVKLGASASAAGSNWSTLYTLADTDAGRPHDSADGTKGDGIVTWAEWNREFGTISSGTADFTQADDTWTTASAHGLNVGDSLEFTSSDANPSEYSTGVTYYVVTVDTTTTFQLSTTPGGSVLAGTVDSGASWGYDALTSFEWSEIAGAAGGSFDGVAATRVLLKHAASGVHAGKLSTMDAFLREFVDPAYQFLLKPLEYSSPQFTKVVADNRDVTDGGLVLDNFLDLISPAGTSTVVSASSTPMKESAKFAFLSDYYGEGTGTFGPQGLVNEAGGAVAGSLMQYPAALGELPLLGGVIGPAPLGPGCALLAGHRVSLKPDTASTVYDLGNGTSENFDIIVGLSSVTLPASGARTVASGTNWALKLESTGAVTLDWGAASHTSTDTYDFDNKSDVAVQYVRINKVDTTLKVFVQDSLFSDWDDNQLGDDITVASTVTSAGATDFIILADVDPTSDVELGSLSCAVHRVLLFTASNGTAAWSESAGEYYDYGNADLDANLSELSSSDYYATTGITMNAVDFDITDSGGANELADSTTANDLTIANDGTYDYVNISTQELSVYDDEPLFVHDEFSMSVTVMDPLSTSAFDLVDYAHTDISTNFTVEFVQSSGLKLRVSLTDGTNTLTYDVDASSWSGTTDWHTVTATYSASNGLTVYVDGAEDGSDDSADLVFVDTSQNDPAVDLGRLSNVMIGGGSGATGDVDCRYVAFHKFEMTAAQALALAGELGTV
jgi:hypothetical protein